MNYRVEAKLSIRGYGRYSGWKEGMVLLSSSTVPKSNVSSSRFYN